MSSFIEIKLKRTPVPVADSYTDCEGVVHDIYQSVGMSVPTSTDLYTVPNLKAVGYPCAISVDKPSISGTNVPMTPLSCAVFSIIIEVGMMSSVPTFVPCWEEGLISLPGVSGIEVGPVSGLDLRYVTWRNQPFLNGTTVYDAEVADTVADVTITYETLTERMQVKVGYSQYLYADMVGGFIISGYPIAANTIDSLSFDDKASIVCCVHRNSTGMTIVPFPNATITLSGINEVVGYAEGLESYFSEFCGEDLKTNGSGVVTIPAHYMPQDLSTARSFYVYCTENMLPLTSEQFGIVEIDTTYTQTSLVLGEVEQNQVAFTFIRLSK